MGNIAYAMGQGGAQAGQGSPGGMLVPLILMFAIFYFLVIRPQQKKQKEHREMINNVKKGDRIITGGGIHGRITGASDTTLTVEIADKVRIKLNRGNVGSLVQAASPTGSEKDKKANSEKK